MPESIDRVTVFGSAALFVSPDLAVIRGAVEVLRDTPAAALSEARTALNAVRACTDCEVNASKVKLADQFQGYGTDRAFLGYQATIELRAVLLDPSQVDDVLTALVDAGMQRVMGVDYHTRQLALHRREARRQAVQAARAKAELYAEAAGRTVGDAMEIEDKNPLRVRGHGESRSQTVVPDDPQAPGALDPGAILVQAAVGITYRMA